MRGAGVNCLFTGSAKSWKISSAVASNNGVLSGWLKTSWNRSNPALEADNSISFREFHQAVIGKLEYISLKSWYTQVVKQVFGQHGVNGPSVDHGLYRNEFCLVAHFQFYAENAPWSSALRFCPG